MASPFTVKASSVMPCTDIIKQGRSTLVTTVQVGMESGAQVCCQSTLVLSQIILGLWAELGRWTEQGQAGQVHTCHHCAGGAEWWGRHIRPEHT